MAKSIPVKANDSIIYHIELVHDFSMFPAFLQELGYGRSQKICIVTDSNVAPLYARDVQDLLEKKSLTRSFFIRLRQESTIKILRR